MTSRFTDIFRRMSPNSLLRWALGTNSGDPGAVCERDLSPENLHGGKIKGDEVFLGEQPIAECCKFLEHNKIVRNFRTHWKTSYPEGHIDFERGVRFARDGEIFDRRTQTVYGRKVFIFKKSEKLEFLAEKRRCMNELVRYANLYTQENLLAYAEVIREASGERRG